MIRIGIVGCGGMAKLHAESFQAIEGVKVSACMDIDAARAYAFSRHHGIDVATSQLEELLDVVDAVAVVTPDAFHVEPTIAALQANKHVLCEKPLTVEIQDANRIAELSEQKPGLIGMVNFSYRRSSALHAARQWVAEGRLGAVRHVQAHYLQSWLLNDANDGWPSEGLLWRLKTAKGSRGVLGDTGVHILDMTSAVMGDFSRVRCSLRTFPKQHAGQEMWAWNGEVLDANDSAVIEVETPGGAFGVIQATRWAAGHENHLRLEVHGTLGALRFDLDEDESRLDYCLGDDVAHARWRSQYFPKGLSIWETFVGAIKSGAASQPDLRRGAAVQSQLQACLQSSESEQWCSVDAMHAERIQGLDLVSASLKQARGGLIET